MRALPTHLNNKRFGFLRVIKFVHGSGGWLCRCDCGNERYFHSFNLTSGNNISCGCKGNHTRKREFHGLCRIPEYLIWKSIKARCLNPSNKDYVDYGGRGIRICEQWKDSFFKFISDVGRRPQKGLWLDRINNNGNYEPGNVAWRTPERQQRNKRDNHLYEIKGERITLKEAVEKYARKGISYHSVKSRLNCGWTLEKAISAPIRGTT